MATAGVAPHCVVPPEDQIGRIGVMHGRTLLAQSCAFANTETSSGDDHLATNLMVYAAAHVLVFGMYLCGPKNPMCTAAVPGSQWK